MIRKGLLSALLMAAAAAATFHFAALAAERVVLAPEAARHSTEPARLQTAIFAGGCFWGVEGVFSHVNGVTSVVSGYHGGERSDATYAQVSSGGTGHAEAVRITYDPRRVRYDQLLRIFFSVVTDPTQLNRQGPDVGTQYRNALVPTTEEQRLVASAYIAQLRTAGTWPGTIVTRIERLDRFYPAEVYHQDFILKNPRHPYILRWDAPKVEALRRLFPQLYRRGFTTG